MLVIIVKLYDESLLRYVDDLKATMMMVFVLLVVFRCLSLNSNEDLKV